MQRTILDWYDIGYMRKWRELWKPGIILYVGVFVGVLSLIIISLFAFAALPTDRIFVSQDKQQIIQSIEHNYITLNGTIFVPQEPTPELQSAKRNNLIGTGVGFVLLFAAAIVTCYRYSTYMENKSRDEGRRLIEQANQTPKEQTQ